jgi:L-threonylcarbamoyladenylate synthase
LKTEWLSDSNASLERARELLVSGGIAALPTETVYGLAGNAFDANAVLKIFKAKERPSFDPLIVHVSKGILDHPSGPLEALIEEGIVDPIVLSSPLAESLKRAMMRYWPGPLTIVLPKGPKIPSEVTSGEPTVGIRVPDHPLFQKILSGLSFPLAAPSANRFGRISPTTADHVKSELDGRISAIVDGGPCTVGVESTIIAVSGNRIRILRPGKISKEDLERHFGGPVILEAGLVERTGPQIAPGMLDQHYAPRKPLYLHPEPATDERALVQLARDLGLHGRPGFLIQRDLSYTGSLEEAARKLFSEMRGLDQDPMVDFIVADLPPGIESGLGAAIADRLNRASVNKPLKRYSS